MRSLSCAFIKGVDGERRCERELFWLGDVLRVFSDGKACIGICLCIVVEYRPCLCLVAIDERAHAAGLARPSPLLSRQFPLRRVRPMYSGAYERSPALLASRPARRRRGHRGNISAPAWLITRARSSCRHERPDCFNRRGQSMSAEISALCGGR